MAHDYTGNPTGITPTTPLTIHEPDDGDADNVASVNPTVFERLANWIAFLFSFVPFMGGANGGTAYSNPGPNGGTGLTVTAGTGGSGNANAIRGVNHGTGYALRGESAASATGDVAQLDATAGVARALNASNNAPLLPAAAFVNNDNTGSGTSSAGATAVIASAPNVADHVGKAVAIPDGLIAFTGGLSPAAATALKNRISPMLCIKGWAYVTTTGGVATLQDGQNVASVAIVAGGGSFTHNVRVNWAQAFASAIYGVFHCNALDGAGVPHNLLTSLQQQLGASADVGFWDTGTNANVDPNSSNTGVLIVAVGLQ
jgi:hypothetical protein